jgi:AraC-like DNA-binding protein
VARSVEEDSRGIVDPAALLARVHFSRHDPSAEVARFVAWYWAARWDLPAGGTHRQAVLSHPAVNVTFGPDRADVHGVHRRMTERVLDGQGWVLGVLFRPAGFRPLLGRPLRTITDRDLPLASLGDVTGDVGRRVAAATDAGPAAQASVVDAWLADVLPDGPQPCEEASALVEVVAADRSLQRVDDLARLVGVGVRRLQRTFSDQVGASPKWVIRRYRLYDAAERAVHDDAVDWAAVAAELGYSDQAHLTREFTRAFGLPPARYAASLRPSRPPHPVAPAGR